MIEDILDSSTGKNNSGLSDRMKQNLLGAAKWAKVIAIIQIVFIGLACLAGLFAILVSPIAGIISLAFYSFFLYMCIVLLQFGTKATQGLNSNNQNAVEESVEKLHLWFKMISITTIVVLAIYAVVILIFGAAIFGGASSFRGFR